jgi:hypothetical protein
MNLCDVEKIPELADRPILSDRDPRAVALMNPNRAEDIAEAVDTLRLFDLIHRNEEYRPMAIVCFGAESTGDVKVYFARVQCGDE